MALRLPTFWLAALAVLPTPGRADLSLPLSGRQLPARPAAPPASRSAPPQPLRQVGVARRGGVPVLPPVQQVAGRPAPAPVNSVPVDARLGRATGPTTDVFRQPDPRSPWIGRLLRDQQVAIVRGGQGWFAILMADGTQGYVPQTHIEVLPYQVRSVIPAPVPARTSTAFSPVPEPLQQAEYVTGRNSLAQAVIEEALRYRGVRYVYGGNSESGIDCSGLVKNCFEIHGVRLPRRAGEQAQLGEPVPLDQLQPGDRLYFSVKKPNDHTGIYLGGGYFVHASRSRGKVTVEALTVPLYGGNLTSARRF